MIRKAETAAPAEETLDLPLFRTAKARFIQAIGAALGTRLRAQDSSKPRSLI